MRHRRVSPMAWRWGLGGALVATLISLLRAELLLLRNLLPLAPPLIAGVPALILLTYAVVGALAAAQERRIRSGEQAGMVAGASTAAVSGVIEVLIVLYQPRLFPILQRATMPSTTGIYLFATVGLLGGVMLLAIISGVCGGLGGWIVRFIADRGHPQW